MKELKHLLDSYKNLSDADRLMILLTVVSVILMACSLFVDILSLLESFF